MTRARLFEQLARMFQGAAEAQGKKAQEAFSNSDLASYQAHRVNATLMADLARGASIESQMAAGDGMPGQGFEPSDEPVRAHPEPGKIYPNRPQAGQQINRALADAVQIAREAGAELASADEVGHQQGAGEPVPIVRGMKRHRRAPDDRPRPAAHTPAQVGGNQGDKDAPGDGEGS